MQITRQSTAVGGQLKKLVCLGDSFTYGYGVPRAEIWTRLAADALGIEVVNAGICGDTTAGMLARLEHGVFSKRPSHVLIFGGGNDILATGSCLTARAGLWALAHQVMARGAAPLLALLPRLDPEGVPPRWAAVIGDVEQAAACMDALNEWIRAAAEGFGIPAVDLSDCLEGERGLHLDGIHPSAEGHRRMSRVLTNAMKPLL